MSNVNNMLGLFKKGLTPIIRAYAPEGSQLTCNNNTYTLNEGELYHDFSLPFIKTNLLPEGYTGLEYIQSTGTQYINTGYDNKHGFNAILKASFSDFSSSNCVIGSLYYSGSTYWRSYFQYYSSSSAMQFGFYSAYPTFTTLTANQDYEIEVNTFSGNGYVKIDGVTKTSSTVTFSDSSSIDLHLMNNNYSADQVYFRGKIYYCEIRDEDGNLVRNFLPCKRDSDSAIGMYDTVTQTFFENAGTGVFSCGDEKEWCAYETYTVTATLGTKKTNASVIIDEIAIYSCELNYTLYLYNLGDECIKYTGGWSVTYYYAYDGHASWTKKDTYLWGSVGEYDDAYGDATSMLSTASKIDITNFSTIKAHVISFTANASPTQIKIGVTQTNTSFMTTVAAYSASITDDTIECDISSLTGEYYPCISFGSWNVYNYGNATVDLIWFE